MYVKPCVLGYILCSLLSISTYAVQGNYITMPKGSVDLRLGDTAQLNALASSSRNSAGVAQSGSVLAGTYCAYCRRRELVACIKCWCYRGLTVSVPQSSKTQRFNSGIPARVPFADPSVIGPGGFGPGGSTLADMYCAYCRRRGLTACIRRWCYRRIIGIPPSALEQIPSLGITPTAPFTNTLAQMNAVAPSVGGPGGFGPGGSTLADMYCAYCRRRGLTACIRRWCYRRIAGVSPASFADSLASFLARRDPNLANIYCAYCRRHGLVDCIRRWCYGRRTIISGIKQLTLY